MSTESNTGRVAVITGASSGIGEATARALAADGYRVALLARRADRIQALADELGDGAIAIEADVTDRDSLVAAAQRVQDELGGADVLVNNAGVMLLAPFTSEQRAEQRQMVEVNLLGAMTATEVFLDQLRDGGGDLINISSVAGRTARAGNAAYAATKWGLNGWSEALRQELQPDVRVIVIEPGAVATELVDHITHGETKQGIEQFYDGHGDHRRRHRRRSSPSPSPGRAACRSTRSSSGPPPSHSDGRRMPSTMQRRTFLRVALAGVAGAAVGVPSSACGAESPRAGAWPDPAGVLLAPGGELLVRRQEEPQGRQHRGAGPDRSARDWTATCTASEPPIPTPPTTRRPSQRNVREQEPTPGRPSPTRCGRSTGTTRSCWPARSGTSGRR